MSKRFTETEIWSEDWFIEMPKEYKLFYFYLKDQCNHAGIWRPNLRIFEAINEVKIDLKKAVEYFNKDKERVQILTSGHWYLLDFFVFQYGRVFNCSNRVHESIQNIYNKEDIKLTSIRGLLDHKDRVKDKDKDKDKDNNKKIVFDFVKPEYKEAFETWIEYKKARNEKYKNQKSLEACYNKLIKLSSGNPVAALEIINNSMANNWAGLFPLKKDKTDEVPYKLKITTGAFSR